MDSNLTRTRITLVASMVSKKLADVLTNNGPKTNRQVAEIERAEFPIHQPQWVLLQKKSPSSESDNVNARGAVIY